MTTEAKTKVDWKKFGKALAAARAKKSYTLRQLEELTGVDFRTILRAETGAGLRQHNYEKLAKWLKRQR